MLKHGVNIIMALESVKAEFQIEFETHGIAEIILKSLEPEILSSPSQRSATNFKLTDKTLILEINAADVTSLRASVNSYLRWIRLSYDIIKLQ